MSEGTEVIVTYFTPLKGSGNKNTIDERRTIVINDNAVVVTGFYTFTRMVETSFRAVAIYHACHQARIAHHHSSPHAPKQTFCDCGLESAFGGGPKPRARQCDDAISSKLLLGFAEGRNVTIEYRWAENQLDRLPELAAELVRRRVAVIATPADTPATLVTKAATATIPIVFEIGGDPVQAGLVASFNQPGGNVTGITSMNLELPGKLLGLLHELLPRASRFAVLVNPNNSIIAEATITDARAAAMSIGRQIEVLTASTNREIDMVFASLGPKQVDALLVNNDPLFNSRRVHVVTLATYHRVPTIYPYRECVEAGGLMSYGSNLPDLVRQVGVYSGRILKGERPADLPVLRATKFELVINLQTAKTFGLVVPPTLLARADEVIE